MIAFAADELVVAFSLVVDGCSVSLILVARYSDMFRLGQIRFIDCSKAEYRVKDSKWKSKDHQKFNN